MRNIIRSMCLAIALLGCLLSQPAAAQTDEHKLVEKIIYRLFENMAAHDTTALRAMFTEDAELVSVFTTTQGEEVRTKERIDKFINSIGRAANVKLDERIWDVVVQIDGGLAQVWNSYAFYANDQFSHCGVDAYLLHKKNGSWKIFHLADTRTKRDCDIPEEIKNQK